MIELPDGTSPNSATPALVDFGFDSQPALGGSSTRTNRPGNRFKVAVTLPPVKSDREGRVLVSRLIQAKTQGLRIAWPLNGFKSLPMGNPLANSATAQLGTSLLLDGFVNGTVVYEGQFFSIEVGGKNYLHVAVSDSVSVGGAMTVTFEPPLRAAVPDNTPIEFANPVFEGVVDGQEWAWQLSVGCETDISFSLMEKA